MKRVYLPAIGLLISATVTSAAPAQQRIRGTISAAADSALTIHTTDGSDQQILLNSETKYLRVVRSDLDKVEPGSYIGTATKTVGSSLVALEVVVFPPSMRGAGEGHYDWDQIPDTTISSHSKTGSSMTNGNVSAVQASKTTVKSAMTNGNVASASSQNGNKKITVTYNGGEQTIVLPPTAPLVTFQPGSKSDAAKSASVFVQVTSSNEGSPVAQLVAVGVDGVTPPM